MRSSLIPSWSARNSRRKCGTWVEEVRVKRPGAVVREHAARLDRRARRAVVDHAALDDHVGRGEAGLEVAAAERPLVALVRAEVGVDEVRPVLERLLDVDDHRQRVVLDQHLLGGVDHRVAVGADHERDRVADAVDLVLGDGPVRRVLDLDPRRHPRHRQRRLEVEVVAGEDRVHARVVLGRAGVDRGDLRVRLGRAHERRPQLPGDVDVVDVARAAHDQPRVLLALDRPPDPGLGRGGGHASEAARTALTMLW